MLNKIDGETFFNKLYEDEEFCKQLGKVMLSAAKLETQLIKLLENSEDNKKNMQYDITMGVLIRKIENAKLLPENTIIILKELAEQRNHLTHNIFIIFSDTIENPKLIEKLKDYQYIKKNLLELTSEEKEYFLYSDTNVYTERAYILADNLNSIANSIKSIIKEKK
ncbi:MAG: hypothetical protein AB1389_02480 [Campylobacterota bacterium]